MRSRRACRGAARGARLHSAHPATGRPRRPACSPANSSGSCARSRAARRASCSRLLSARRGPPRARPQPLAAAARAHRQLRGQCVQVERPVRDRRQRRARPAPAGEHGLRARQMPVPAELSRRLGCARRAAASSGASDPRMALHARTAPQLDQRMRHPRAPRATGPAISSRRRASAARAGRRWLIQ